MVLYINRFMNKTMLSNMINHIFSILIGIWIKAAYLISHVVQYINRFMEKIRLSDKPYSSVYKRVNKKKSRISDKLCCLVYRQIDGRNQDR